MKKKSAKKPTHESSDLETDLRLAIENSERSQSSIALEAGIAAAQLSRFVRQERTLNLKAAGQVAKVLGLRLKSD